MFSLSRFQEVMKGLPQGVLDREVKRHGSDKHCKGFNTRSQLVALVYGQISGASSLRELEAGYNSQWTHHYHLNARRVRRSTLADVNAKRPAEVFAAVAQTLMRQLGRPVREDEQMLHLIDSTTITLKGRGFDAWTAATKTRCGQGLKLHLLWDGQIPRREAVTATNINDRDVAVTWPLEAGVTYVFDKGYCDYAWWHRIGEAGATFVTRFKSNAALKVSEIRPIDPTDDATILSDEVVGLKYRYARGGRPASPTLTLRRITVTRPDRDSPLVLATNDMTRSASQIAQCYRARWQIELFFKWIKQHLKVKRFLGRSQNAVRIQLYCALIAYLLLSLYRRKHSDGTTTMWMMVNQLRNTLFERPSSHAHWYRRRCESRAEMAARQGNLLA
jgi:IS4 transposase